jgi:hypothetical protein
VRKYLSKSKARFTIKNDLLIIYDAIDTINLKDGSIVMLK